MTARTKSRVTHRDVEIGLKIRQARLDRNMKQNALADAAGVTFQQIQKYENGKNRVSAVMLEKIARAVKRPLVWFFPDTAATGQPGERDAVLRFAATNDGLAVIHAFGAIKDVKVQRLLRELMEAIAK